MKNQVLNILSIILLVGTLVALIGFIVIFNDPHSFLNPFPPPTWPTIAPTPTITNTPFKLPATWTPNSPAVIESETPSATSGLLPSSTPMPSATTFIVPSFTPTRTATFKPANTRVRTSTATDKPEVPTDIPTATEIPVYPNP